MSHSILNLIYGIPLTEEIRQAAKSVGYHSPDNYGFEPLYSASGPEWGYCGSHIKSFHEGQPVLLQSLPTADGSSLPPRVVNAARRAIEDLPEDLVLTLKELGQDLEPHLHIIWESS